MGRAFKLTGWDAKIEDDGFCYPIWLSRPEIEVVRLAMAAASVSVLDINSKGQTAERATELARLLQVIEQVREHIESVVLPVEKGKGRNGKSLIRIKRRTGAERI